MESLADKEEPRENTAEVEVREGEKMVAPFKLGQNLTEDQREKAMELLQRYSILFAKEGQPLTHPYSREFEHRIETGDHPPVACPPAQCAPIEREKIRKEVEEMLQLGVIEPSNSAWATRVVLVKKPDGSVRFCIDWRGLNAATIRDVYPIPRTMISLTD